MALNKDSLKSDLRGVFAEMRDFQGGEDAALDVFVDKLSSTFVKHMKTIEIKYTNGLTAPNGAVTGVINHTVE